MTKINDILTLSEAAEYLKLKKSGLYKLTSKRKIKHSKPSGKKIYFSRRDLDQWAMSGNVEPINEG